MGTVGECEDIAPFYKGDLIILIKSYRKSDKKQVFKIMDFLGSPHNDIDAFVIVKNLTTKKNAVIPTTSLGKKFRLATDMERVLF